MELKEIAEEDISGNFMKLNNILAPFHNEHAKERAQIFALV
jgi:hypothetical protein